MTGTHKWIILRHISYVRLWLFLIISLCLLEKRKLQILLLVLTIFGKNCVTRQTINTVFNILTEMKQMLETKQIISPKPENKVYADEVVTHGN